MEVGDAKQKQEFLDNLTKSFQENVWKEEAATYWSSSKVLGNVMKEKATLDLELDE